MYRPTRACGTGVLVLAGSSGRVDTQRAELLARHGAVALPLRWFGGPGQPPGPWDVPIEYFTRALDQLANEADRLTIVGVSFGAEAALVTASLDQRIRAVAAFAPSSVIWAGYDQARQRWTSHWTWRGEPLPFVPIRRPATPATETGAPSYVPVYRESLRAAGEDVIQQATIRVERIPEVLVVSGGDDQVWPAADFALAIQARRASFRRDTAHVHLPEAGHRAVLPGEAASAQGRAMARGGSPEADVLLGQLAWPHLHRVLKLMEA